MKTLGIEVIRPIVRRQKLLTRFYLQQKKEGPVITEADLQFTKVSLRLSKVQKKF